MIEILDRLAVAECLNCGGEIARYQGDLSSKSWWSHEATGNRYCPDSPMATPKPGTVS